MEFQPLSVPFFSKCEIWVSRYKIYHFIFWMVYASTIAAFIRVDASWIKSFVLQLPILSLHAAVVYFNLYFLVPRFLLTKKYLLFLISIILLIGSVLFPIAIITHSILEKTQNLLVSENVWSSLFLFLIALGLFFSLLLSTVLKFIKGWYFEQQFKKDLQQEQLQAELLFLKTQINPHFLFNSLNNLYALTLKKSDLAPQIVLKLSDILRYLLYESAGKVDFLKEIQYITDYVELEKLRLGDSVDIEIDLEKPDQDYLVEPMLYLTLIENAFKYCGILHDARGWVIIRGSNFEGGYCVLVENSLGDKISQNTNGGIGLINLKKRLGISYPNLHVLDIIKDSRSYAVTLKIIFNYENQ